MTHSRTMQGRPALAAIGALAVLSACSAQDCGDARSDGLLTAAGCTVGGGYTEQTEELRATAERRQSLADELRAENAALSSRMNELEGQERQVANRLIAANNEVAAMDEQLSEQLRRQRISQTEYDLKRAELEALETRRAQIEPTDPQAEARIAALEQEIAELRRFLG